MELGLSRDRRTRLGWVAAAAAIALALLVALLQTTGSRREELAVAPRRGPTSSEVEPRGRDPRPTAYAPSVVVASQAERRIEPRPEPSPPPAPSQPPPAPHPTAVAARPAVAAPTPAQALARPARKLPEFMRVTPDTPACEIHDVKRGDTLWAISARRLGDPYRWPQVYGQNRDHLVDPNVIEIDDRIRIPGACQPAVVK
jgi:nucleoid-associated protein YgaU